MMRKYIDLLEAAAQGLPSVKEGFYRLYRGDSATIEKFEVAKTSLYSLFGHGIYLTDNRRVAGDYTSKESGTGDVIFTLGGAKTKEEVLSRWIEKQAAKIDINGVDHSGEIAYWSSNVEFSDGGDWGAIINDLRKQERATRIDFARDKWRRLAKDYEVRIKLDGSGVIQKKTKKSNASIAVFDVPMDYLSRVLHADAEINSTVLSDLIDILNKYGDRETARDIQSFVRSYEAEDGFLPSFRQVYTGITAGSPFINDEEAHAEFRTALGYDGFVGIEYTGGVTMGGGYKHRAFVFWNEEDINKYRIA